MDKQLLFRILETQSYSYQEFRMFARIVRELQNIPGVSYCLNEGNLYVTKGESEVYPCIVSHMDTVHKIKKGNLVPVEVNGAITGVNSWTMEQSGIGGDDKNGVFICLSALIEFDVMKAVFFSTEECGCVGSYKADMKFFDNCSFVLQCDRRGNTDFVIDAGIELSGKSFQDTIFGTLREHGYQFSDGAMTDVMALKENGLKVCCANISCGYYRPHMNDEFIVLADLECCMHLVFDLFSRFGHIVFPHEAPRTRWVRGYRDGRDAIDFNTWTQKEINDYFSAKYGPQSKVQFPPKKSIQKLEVEPYDIEDAHIGEGDKCCDNCGNGYDEAYVSDTDPFCDFCGMHKSEIDRWATENGPDIPY